MKNILLFILCFIVFINISACENISTMEGKCSINEDSVLYPVIKNNKYGYIDSNGNLKIEPQFDSAQGFYDGLAVVYEDGLAGYINKNGQYVIKPQFTYAGRFFNGIAPYGVKTDNHPRRPFSLQGFIN